MTWYAKERDEYIYVVSITGELNPKDYTVISFILHKDKNNYAKILVDKFLKEIEDDSLVELKLDNGKNFDDEEIRYGGARRSFSFHIDFWVYKEDAEKIEAENPIRMRVNTDVYPYDKKAFFDVFQDLSMLLS